MSGGDAAVESEVRSRSRQPKAMTRVRILEKAYQLYREGALTQGDERLSTVLESLGYTTGAGYQIWPNQAAFRLDLQAYIVEQVDYASLASIGEDLIEIRDRRLPLREHVLTVGEYYINHLCSSDDFYLILRFYAMGEERPDSVTEAMGRAYETVGAELEVVLMSAFERYGRRMREGHTIGQLGMAVTALCEGFALRHRVHPELPKVETTNGPRHPFAVGLLALILEFTEEV